MYWWNASKLEVDLREGRVDEKERFRYFLATFVAWSVVVHLSIYSGIPFSIDSLIWAAVNVTVTVISIALCYRVNKSGDNIDFIGRMICLGWPAGVIFVLTYSVLELVFPFLVFLRALALGTPLSFLSTALPGIWDRWIHFSGILFIVPYYLMICWRIAYVAQAKEAQKAIEIVTTEMSVGESALAFVGLIGIPITVLLAYLRASSLVGSGMLAKFITCLAVGLWVLLFGSIFVWLRRRSMRRA